MTWFTITTAWLRAFSPYALVLLGIVAECVAMRRDDRFGGTFAAILACVALVGGGWLLGRDK